MTFYSYERPLVVKLLFSFFFFFAFCKARFSAELCVGQTQAVCGPRGSGDLFSSPHWCWNRGRKVQTLV